LRIESPFGLIKQCYDGGVDMNMTIFAIGCHPDDIEFLMSGTLFLLKNAGCEVHVMIIANGDCGSLQYNKKELAEIRRREAQDACSVLGAHFHDSVANDIEVFYSGDLIKKVAAVVREVQPDILLLMSPNDYMEDHMNASRLGVTAAFTRGMPNYVTDPIRPAYQKDVALYHAEPHGLHDQLNSLVLPDFFVDITSVIDRKQEMLSMHKSQQEWLGVSQGLNSYLNDMRKLSAQLGELSGVFQYAEGFRRHNYLGFSEKPIDPLKELLAAYIMERTTL